MYLTATTYSQIKYINFSLSLSPSLWQTIAKLSCKLSLISLCSNQAINQRIRNFRITPNNKCNFLIIVTETPWVLATLLIYCFTRNLRGEGIRKYFMVSFHIFSVSRILCKHCREITRIGTWSHLQFACNPLWKHLSGNNKGAKFILSSSVAAENAN